MAKLVKKKNDSNASQKMISHRCNLMISSLAQIVQNTHYFAVTDHISMGEVPEHGGKHPI